MKRVITSTFALIALFSAFSVNADTIGKSYRGDVISFDPAVNYSSVSLMSDLYITPMQYQFGTDVVQLEPLALSELPEIIYLDKNKQKLTVIDKETLAKYTQITLRFKKYLLFQSDDVVFSNYPNHTRSITSKDYAYQLKRVADPKLQSNYYYLLTSIEGFEALHDKIMQKRSKDSHAFIDFRDYVIPGIQTPDDQTLVLTLNGVLPQIRYWLTMSVFSPMPFELAEYYHTHCIFLLKIGTDSY